MRPADPCVGEVLLGGEAPFFNSAICVSSPELFPNPPGKAENGSDCTWVGLSQPTFRPTSTGLNLAVWVWLDCPTPVGSDCLNMKTFVGRIVTVPEGAGRSVTVSNWGVAQSSRHQRMTEMHNFLFSLNSSVYCSRIFPEKLPGFFLIGAYYFSYVTLEFFNHVNKFNLAETVSNVPMSSLPVCKICV